MTASWFTSSLVSKTYIFCCFRKNFKSFVCFEMTHVHHEWRHFELSGMAFIVSRCSIPTHPNIPKPPPVPISFRHQYIYTHIPSLQCLLSPDSRNRHNRASADWCLSELPCILKHVFSAFQLWGTARWHSLNGLLFSRGLRRELPDKINIWSRAALLAISYCTLHLTPVQKGSNLSFWVCIWAHFSRVECINARVIHPQLHYLGWSGFRGSLSHNFCRTNMFTCILKV